MNTPRPVSPAGNAPAPRRGVQCANLHDFMAARAHLHSASQHARRGHHPLAFAEIREANRLSSAPLIRAHAAFLIATWHKQGVTRFAPLATHAVSPDDEADAWTTTLLLDIKRGQLTDCDDAELMALSVQLLVHVWPDHILARLTQRIVLLLYAGTFRHEETAVVLRDLVVPQLLLLGLQHEADLAKRCGQHLLPVPLQAQALTDWGAFAVPARRQSGSGPRPWSSMI